jgi:hypothetical protein
MKIRVIFDLKLTSSVAEKLLTRLEFGSLNDFD